jgi:hypothetical protein
MVTPSSRVSYGVLSNNFESSQGHGFLELHIHLGKPDPLGADVT